MVSLGYVNGNGVKRRRPNMCLSSSKELKLLTTLCLLDSLGDSGNGDKSSEYRQRFGLASSPCSVVLPWGKQNGRKMLGLGQVISLHHCIPIMILTGSRVDG